MRFYFLRAPKGQKAVSTVEAAFFNKVCYHRSGSIFTSGKKVAALHACRVFFSTPKNWPPPSAAAAL